MVPYVTELEVGLLSVWRALYLYCRYKSMSDGVGINQGDHLSGKPGMSGNLTAVREMSGILLKIREMPGEPSCQGKVV